MLYAALAMFTVPNVIVGLLIVRAAMKTMREIQDNRGAETSEWN